MGRGLVSTVDNFGRTGQEPSHPELLDYLARRLIRDGWSTKKLIREIVLTQTFAQSSKRTLRNEEIDPENRWYWRAFVRRLDPEALRDAILASAGELDLGRVDSTVAYLGDQATAVGANKVRRRTDFPNRSVFLPVIRNDLPELFEAFDFADPHIATGARPQTLVPSQALFLMNDEAVIASAGKLVDRLGALEDGQLLDEQIGALAQLTGVSLDDEARQAMHQFVGQVESSGATRAAALKQLAHALFCSSQFQFID